MGPLRVHGKWSCYQNYMRSYLVLLCLQRIGVSSPSCLVFFVIFLKLFSDYFEIILSCLILSRLVIVMSSLVLSCLEQKEVH
jgi:hypothetical protein